MTIKDMVARRRRAKNVPIRRGEDPVEALQRGMDSLFEHLRRNWDLWPSDWLDSGHWPIEADFGGLDLQIPSVDVTETSAGIQVTAELPGMTEKDIDLSLSPDAVTIKGEKTDESEQEEKDYRVHERRFGSVQRMVPLPAGIDLDAAKATFKNGVLTIELPKTAEARKAVRKVDVNAA
jgi:HSP20 family protein